MDILTTLLIAIGLAMDCLAVSLGIGTSGQARAVRPVFRIAFHFGLFQLGMTVIGWAAGSTIANFIASFDHWISFGLLAWVGGRMIFEGFNPKDEEGEEKKDPTRGGTMVMLSIATSIDAMAVGLSLALLNVDILTSSLLIGLVSSVLSLFGLLAGHSLGRRFGKRMEILGGLILVGIGLRVLITHLLGG